ncbi:hypothetical protein O6A81_19105 [Clostridioides difficile]|nr:hypothetical protein [Clostridioides difficile]
MKRGTRIIYDQSGKIWFIQTDTEGTELTWSEITELHYLDLEFGSIDYSKQYIESINPVTKELVIKDIPIILTDEQKRLQELENQILLNENEKVGGIL